MGGKVGAADGHSTHGVLQARRSKVRAEKISLRLGAQTADVETCRVREGAPKSEDGLVGSGGADGQHGIGFRGIVRFRVGMLVCLEVALWLDKSRANMEKVTEKQQVIDESSKNSKGDVVAIDCSGDR